MDNQSPRPSSFQTCSQRGYSESPVIDRFAWSMLLFWISGTGCEPATAGTRSARSDTRYRVIEEGKRVAITAVCSQIVPKARTVDPNRIHRLAWSEPLSLV